MLVNAGRDRIAELIAGEEATAFDESNAHIGVGDSNSAAAAGQTDLQGTNKARKAVDAGYPIVSANQITYRATFGTSDANFDWQEWGVFDAATNGTMLNRFVEDLDTKPDTQTWQFTVTLELAAS